MMIYLLLMVPPMLLALWAQWKVHSTFKSAHDVPATSGLTGAEVAQMILEANNIRNVGIEPAQGFLSDHYDPKAKMLRLSSDVYHGHSVASLGIAAHEAGHAIQDATNYLPLRFRNGIVGFAMVGGNFAWILIMAGAAMAAAGAMGGIGKWIMFAGIGLFSITVLFQLINLPVEFDASNRAKRLLDELGMVDQQGASAVKSVLGAAAWTYVAATLQSVLTVLYYVIQILGSSRRSDRE